MARGAPTAHRCGMDRMSRPTPARGPSDTAGIAGAPALWDAAAILARAEADESAADEARERYRTQPMNVLAPDDRIAPLLVPGEQVVAVRRGVVLDRRQPAPGSDSPVGLAGDLYLTSRRLVLVGRLTLSFDLDRMDEAMLSGDTLLLVMHDGQGASLEVAEPRLLRVEIAAARASARA
jgi:hypothetical protein